MGVKLPDYTSLGNPAIGMPSERVASYNPTPVSEAVQKLGNTGFNEGMDLKNILDTADVNNAYANDYAPKAAELAANYYSLEGKAAVDGQKGFTDAMTNLRQETVSNLDGAASRSLEKLIQDHEQRELYAAAQHAGQQAKVYNDQSYKAMYTNDLTDYSNNILDDPTSAKAAMDGADQQLTLHLGQQGITPDDPIYKLKKQGLQDDFTTAQQGAIQQRLMSMPADQQLALLKPLIHGTPAPGAGSAMPTTSDGIIDTVMNHLEGDQLVQNDNGHGPSKYGIVGKSNGLTPEQVAALTPDQAKQIYMNNYWKPAGIDALPDNMKMIAFDTAVQFGVGAAKGMIAQAGNDPQKLLDIRTQKYQQIVASNPDKYGDSADSWQNRTATLTNMLGTPVQQGSAVNNPTLFGQPVAQSTISKLLDSAEVLKAREDRLNKQAQEDANLQTQQDFVGKWAGDQLKPEDILKSNLPALGEGSKKFWLDQVAKGPDKINPNDPDVIKQRGILENMKVDDPKGFMNMDFSTMAGKIPATDISKLQNDQVAMRKGDNTLEAQNKQAKQVIDSVSDMLPTAWKNSKDQDVENQASAFKGNLTSAVRDAQAAGGKPLTRDDIRGLASDMLGNVSVQGHIWDSTMPAYEVPKDTDPLKVYSGTPNNIYIPASFRMGFSRAWQAKVGRPPAESDIRMGYLKSVQK